ncbi:MAG: sigma-54-dependent Fis family transcriptional regulator [Alphaproteobacteria bacterium]|jgi:DNA-binding NtrC family response regulator|nr:sigma-54-dependent Fis family transcriptional regulator [Alphaproteobacteria bacterium]
MPLLNTAASVQPDPLPIKIGVLEDDPIMGESLVQRLTLEGYEAIWWKTGTEALEDLKKNETPDIMICDIRLSDMSGEDVFNQAMSQLESTPVLFITAFGNIEQAVRLMRKGADEYITKPFEMEDFLNRIESLSSRQEISPAGIYETLGVSESMCEIEGTLRRIADVESNVLLTGESGSGKEVAARFLHEVSGRAERPFISVNCAAIPSDLMESELFGHERGAFTGAHGRHLGYAERVGEGTLFLDEIGDLPTHLQGKFLHLIQERKFTRVGGEKLIPFQARVVAATNHDLQVAVAERKFREDLFYRINVIPICVPPLRDRQDDILPLVRGYIEYFTQQFQRDVQTLSSAAEEAVLAYDWPGNVRELRNRIERAVALADGHVLRAQNLFPEADETSAGDEIPTLQQVREASERRHIQRVLEHTGGNVSAAASLLGVSRTTLWEKMKKLGI